MRKEEKNNSETQGRVENIDENNNVMKWVVR